MINNTNTNCVIPVSTKDNSGYIITAVLNSTAGPGGCVLVTTKEELRLIITKQTSEYICTERPKINRCPTPNSFSFPSAILPICDKTKLVDSCGTDIATQTECKCGVPVEIKKTLKRTISKVKQKRTNSRNKKKGTLKKTVKRTKISKSNQSLNSFDTNSSLSTDSESSISSSEAEKYMANKK